MTGILAMASGVTVLIRSFEAQNSRDVFIRNSSAWILSRINHPAKMAISIPPIDIIRLAVS